ncbi:MAG TPA: hypothetical protein IAD14_01645 [Candidatus Coprousia avicola]|nr:hypothetical protein [Candidatus Coprousia avicola]
MVVVDAWSGLPSALMMEFLDWHRASMPTVEFVVLAVKSKVASGFLYRLGEHLAPGTSRHVSFVSETGGLAYESAPFDSRAAGCGTAVLVG